MEILLAANAVIPRLAREIRLWFVEIRKTKFAGSTNSRLRVLAIRRVAHASTLRSLIKLDDRDDLLGGEHFVHQE